MKILFISPNVEMLPDPVFPIGIAYLAGVLGEKGIDCQTLDLCFADDFQAAITGAIADGQPDLVGLSLRNLDNVSYPNTITYLPFYRQVMTTVRAATDVPVVLGGSGFSLMPEDLMDHLGADFGVAGEGEHALVDLVDALADGRLHRERDKGTIFDGRRQPVRELDRLPLPDRSGFDNAAYLQHGGMGNLQTKRGCPFKCVYCTYPLIEGVQMRLRSPESVADEISVLLDMGVDTLFFVDNEFNFPVAHAEDVCRAIIDRKLNFRWSCYANPGHITRQLVDLMRKAGCTSLEFGTDAMTDDMLVHLGKGFTVADVAHASAVCKDVGMPFCHSLLIGGPGETPETMARTLAAMDALEATAVICMVGIRVFPGTSLAQTMIAEGLAEPDTDFIDPVFYLSPAVADTAEQTLRDYAKTHPTWIFPGMNINMDSALQAKLRRFGIKGPLWEYMQSGARRRRRS